MWAYTYRLDPPQSAARLKAIKTLLEREHVTAKERSGTWEGRFVTDDRVSHILVLADTPNLTSEANRRLEDALKAIDARFNLTVPMVVPVEPVEDTPPED